MKILRKISSLKVLFLFAVITCLLNVEVQAQEGNISDKTTKEKASLMTEKQKERIGFDEATDSLMYALNLKYLEEMEVIAQGGRSMETMKKLRDIRSRKDVEVKEILTKDQFKEYKKLRDEMRAQFRADSFN